MTSNNVGKIVSKIHFEKFCFGGAHDIKDTVGAWIKKNQPRLHGKKIADAPAGNGVTSRMLKEVGAEVLAFDLFPDNFQVPNINCAFADLAEQLPLPEQSLDFIVCQEGVEHLANQPKLMTEFSRCLKTGGSLILTCPNSSNIRGRLSYLLGESEYFGKMLPPNEIESLWHSRDEKIYFGHVFLIGISRLRLFSRLAGFEIKTIHSTRLNRSSLLFFPMLAPLIKFFTGRALRRTLAKNPELSPEKITDLRQLAELSSCSKILLESHLFIEFVKIQDSKSQTPLGRHREAQFKT